MYHVKTKIWQVSCYGVCSIIYGMFFQFYVMSCMVFLSQCPLFLTFVPFFFCPYTLRNGDY